MFVVVLLFLNSKEISNWAQGLEHTGWMVYAMIGCECTARDSVAIRWAFESQVWPAARYIRSTKTVWLVLGYWLPSLFLWWVLSFAILFFLFFFLCPSSSPMFFFILQSTEFPRYLWLSWELWCVCAGKEQIRGRI